MIPFGGSTNRSVRWPDSSRQFGYGSARRVAVTDPATGETIDEVPEATTAEVDAAVSSAAEAFGAWRRVDAAERASLLRQLADAAGRRRPGRAARPRAGTPAGTPHRT